MDLEEHYESLWNNSLQKFEQHKFVYDPFLGSKKDRRYGLSLIARPDNKLKQEIAQTLRVIKAVAPGQYYYPECDFHITILSIISCYAGFSLDAIDIAKYQHIIDSVVATISPFKIQFRGLTASPSCIMIRGFPEDDQLKKLREGLRNRFRESGLQHSIDRRYTLKTAHITVIRFSEPLSNPAQFVSVLKKLKDKKFCSGTINQLELVGNDWYMQKQKVRQIEQYFPDDQKMKS